MSPTLRSWPLSEVSSPPSASPASRRRSTPRASGACSPGRSAPPLQTFFSRRDSPPSRRKRTSSTAKPRSTLQLPSSSPRLTITTPRSSLRIMRRTVLLLAVAALVHTGGAWAYNWPLKPFKRQHPIRANFGDPRTAFLNELDDHGMNGPGAFNFHNGIDIPAKGGQPVYSVASGPVHIQSGETVVVRASDRVVFQYVHVTPVVSEGQFAVAQQTILGYVQPWAGHLHFGELDDGKITNPLQDGHLSPYRDRIKPRVGPIAVRDLSGREVSALGVHGRVLLTAEAYDTSSIPAPEPWRGLPVAPAVVSWRLERLSTRTTVVPQTVAVSFRQGLPP